MPDPYVKQTWIDGVAGATPISAARLSYIEDGIENATVEDGTFVPVADLEAEEAARIAADATKAEDTAVVKLTGAQTVEGAKTFASVRTVEPWLDVRARGAVLDNATDDTTAIQNALNDAAAAKGAILIPGQARTFAPLTIPGSNMQLVGLGPTFSRIFNGTTDIFDMTAASSSHLLFTRLSLLASAGHIFNVGATGVGISRSQFLGMSMQQTSTSKSIWNQQAGLFLDNLVMACELSHAAGATVPAWHMVSADGGININVFMRLRCNRSSAYFFRLESTAASSFCNDNAFRDINFEITNGGNIMVLSGHNTAIEQCATYDLSGPTTQHLYHIGKTASGPSSNLTRFKGVQRRGGSLGASLYDVNLAGGQVGSSHFEDMTGSIHMNSTNGTIINSPGATFSGLGAGLQMTLDRTGLYSGSDKLVGSRGAAVADATDSASAVTQLNALLARLRAATGHGLIA